MSQEKDDWKARMLEYGLSDDESRVYLQQSSEEIIEMLNAFSHPNRFKILTLLMEEPRSFSFLKNETDLKKSALSTHLNILRDLSLVRKISHGMYGLTDEGMNYLRAIALLFHRPDSVEITKQKMETARSFLSRHRKSE